MCVIVYSFRGKKEKGENIKRMWDENPHGVGIAYKVQNQVMVRKGFMKLDEFLEFYKNFPEGVPHAIHFRMASAGSVSPIFTHPFTIDKVQIPPKLTYKSNAVIFHNGHIDYYPLLIHIIPHLSEEQRKKLFSLSFSDTYILSLYIALYKVPQILQHLKSKFLIFSADNEKLFGSWEKEEDFYYSNTYWKPRKYFFTTRSYLYDPIFKTKDEK